MEENHYSKKIYLLLLFITFVLIGALCKLLSSVILPVVITVLLTFSFYPPIKKLNEKLHFPWILSVLIILLLFVGFLLGMSTLLVKGLSSIVIELPKYEDRFISIFNVIADNFNLSYDFEQSLFNNLWAIDKVRDELQKIIFYLSSGIFSGGKTFLMIFLLLIFLLIEINSLKTRIINHLGPKPQFDLIKIIRQIISDVSHYLSIKFFISLATGILVYLFSLFIGLNFPIIWGFTAFILNFIPTFGSIFSTLITTLFALLQFYPSYGKVIFVFIYMILINMTLGNVLEPRIEGKQLGLSPFFILVSLSLFGWLWGFIGMIIAVPLTVLMKIVCENIPDLKMIAIILGENRESKINLFKNKFKKKK